MLTLREKGITLQYTNPSSSVAIPSCAISSTGTQLGVVVLVAGINGCVGLAVDTIPASGVGALMIEQVHELAANPTTTGYTETGVIGQPVYFDATNLWTTVVFNGNCTRIGELFQTKNSGDTTMWVKLGGLYGPSGGALSNIIPDPGASGAIPVSASGIIYLTSAGTETRTLAAPAGAGISLILVALNVAAGTVTVNSAAANIASSNKTHMPFAAVNDTVELLSIQTSTAGTYRWALMTNDGVTMT